MLVVESVVPGGPADGVLEPGDVLVSECVSEWEVRELFMWPGWTGYMSLGVGGW